MEPIGGSCGELYCRWVVNATNRYIKKLQPWNIHSMRNEAAPTGHRQPHFFTSNSTIFFQNILYKNIAGDAWCCPASELNQIRQPWNIAAALPSAIFNWGGPSCATVRPFWILRGLLYVRAIATHCRRAQTIAGSQRKFDRTEFRPLIQTQNFKIE